MLPHMYEHPTPCILITRCGNLALHIYIYIHNCNNHYKLCPSLTLALSGSKALLMDVLDFMSFNVLDSDSPFLGLKPEPNKSLKASSFGLDGIPANKE